MEKFKIGIIGWKNLNLVDNRNNYKDNRNNVFIAMNYTLNKLFSEMNYKILNDYVK